MSSIFTDKVKRLKNKTPLKILYLRFIAAKRVKREPKMDVSDTYEEGTMAKTTANGVGVYTNLRKIKKELNTKLLSESKVNKIKKSVKYAI